MKVPSASSAPSVSSRGIRLQGRHRARAATVVLCKGYKNRNRIFCYPGHAFLMKHPFPVPAPPYPVAPYERPSMLRRVNLHWLIVKE